MTKKAFVIGHPVEHTRLPVIHGFWIERYGIDATFEAIDVWPDSVATFLKRLKAGEFVGGNVAKPHKETILPFCDVLTNVAKLTGSVNKLSIENGRIVGDNTDDVTFLKTINYVRASDQYLGKDAVIIGAGAAARSVIFALQSAGFGSIHVLNRTTGKAQAISRLYNNVQAHELSEFTELSRNTALIVNTMDTARDGSRPMQTSFDQVRAETLVVDLAYNPFMTNFLMGAGKRGLQVVDGLSMLMLQAAENFRDWFDIVPAIEDAFRLPCSQPPLSHASTPEPEPQRSYDENDYCAVCETHNGHSLSCPTLGVVKPLDLVANTPVLRIVSDQ